MKNRSFDGWRWWREIVKLNLSNPTYGQKGIDTQLAEEICQRLPHLDYDTVYQLVLDLHTECYK